MKDLYDKDIFNDMIVNYFNRFNNEVSITNKEKAKKDMEKEEKENFRNIFSNYYREILNVDKNNEIKNTYKNCGIQMGNFIDDIKDISKKITENI